MAVPHHRVSLDADHLPLGTCHWLITEAEFVLKSDCKSREKTSPSERIRELVPLHPPSEEGGLGPPQPRACTRELPLCPTTELSCAAAGIS